KLPGGCFASDRSRQRAAELVKALDSTFSAAVAEANRVGPAHHIDFLSLAGAFKGHELCTSEPWVNWLGAVGPELGHPDSMGQYAMAKAVRHWLDAHKTGAGPCAPASSVAGIVDDSGSMDQNDPAGIRRQAIELLLAKPNEQSRTVGAIEFAAGAGPLFA